MPFVLDASVAACWFFPDETHPVASRAWLLIQEDDAMVPAHWWFEVRNTMLVGERRGRSTEQRTGFAINRLERMTIRHAPHPLDADVFALARKYAMTFYDAAYLELAQKWMSLAAHMEQSRERRNRLLSSGSEEERAH